MRRRITATAATKTAAATSVKAASSSTTSVEASAAPTTVEAAPSATTSVAASTAASHTAASQYLAGGEGSTTKCDDSNPECAFHGRAPVCRIPDSSGNSSHPL
jgi:hypothetical protein